MKIITSILGIGVALLLTGCAQPNFNPNDMRINFIEGKAFRLPAGSMYSSGLIDSGDVQIFAKYGVKSRVGYAIWLSPKESAAFNTNVKYKMYKSYADGYAQFIKQGRAHLARPMSKSEIAYYTNQQNQSREDARAAAYRRQASSQDLSRSIDRMNDRQMDMVQSMMPRTHKVDLYIH